MSDFNFWWENFSRRLGLSDRPGSVWVLTAVELFAFFYLLGFLAANMDKFVASMFGLFLLPIAALILYLFASGIYDFFKTGKNGLLSLSIFSLFLLLPVLRGVLGRESLEEIFGLELFRFFILIQVLILVWLFLARTSFLPGSTAKKTDGIARSSKIFQFSDENLPAAFLLWAIFVFFFLGIKFVFLPNWGGAPGEESLALFVMFAMALASLFIRPSEVFKFVVFFWFVVSLPGFFIVLDVIFSGGSAVFSLFGEETSFWAQSALGLLFYALILFLLIKTPLVKEFENRYVRRKISNSFSRKEDRSSRTEKNFLTVIYRVAAPDALMFLTLSLAAAVFAFFASELFFRISSI